METLQKEVEISELRGLCKYHLRTLGFFFDINLFNEVLHKSKAFKRQIWAIISNTISTTPILEIDYFTGSKGIWNWQSNIVNDEGPGFVLTLGSASRRGGRFFGHCSVTQTQCSKSSKFTKHQNSSCSIVMQYTCWHDWDNNVKFFKSSHVRSGSERVRTRSGERISHLSWQLHSREGDTDFQPFCLASGEPRTTPSARIRD